MLLSDLPSRRSTVPDDILSDLSARGVALIDAVDSRAQVIALAQALGATVVPHRDSGPDGVTVIEDRGTRDAALAGFTRSPLFPHTDRSGIPDPPDLLLTVCRREPTSGGDSVLVDGRAVHLDLAENHPDALTALSSPRSALFGGGDGRFSAVFTLVGGVVRIRFRLDALARFSPEAEQYVPLLRKTIERHARAIPVRAGAGYVLDNRRWLHGRASYHGPRSMYRVTANARPGSTVGGFTMPADPGSASERTASPPCP